MCACVFPLIIYNISSHVCVCVEGGGGGGVRVLGVVNVVGRRPKCRLCQHLTYFKILPIMHH